MAAVVELMSFPLKSLDVPVGSHMSNCHMAAVVVDTLVAATVVDGTRNAPILTVGPTFESGVRRDEVAADVRRRMAQLNSCCYKKARLQSCIPIAGGMETLDSRSDRGYLGGTTKVSVLGKAS